MAVTEYPTTATLSHHPQSSSPNLPPPVFHVVPHRLPKSSGYSTSRTACTAGRPPHSAPAPASCSCVSRPSGECPTAAAPTESPAYHVMPSGTTSTTDSSAPARPSTATSAATSPVSPGGSGTPVCWSSAPTVERGSTGATASIGTSVAAQPPMTPGSAPGAWEKPNDCQSVR